MSDVDDEGQEQLHLATDAIEYALRRVGTDAEFAYHMLFTETLDRLIRAYARIKGRDPKVVRDEIMKRTRDLPQSRCAADKEFIDGTRCPQSERDAFKGQVHELIAERDLVDVAELFFVRYQLLGRTHLAGPDHWNALHAHYVEILNLDGATNVELVEAAEVMRR